MPVGLEVIAHAVRSRAAAASAAGPAPWRPARTAAIGSLAGAVVVLAVGQAPVPVGMVLPESFAGVLSPARSGGGLAAAAVIIGVSVLLTCWWRLLAAASAGRVPMRTTAWVAALWAAPVLVGPLLLSYDGYAFLAQGQMAADGLDPYAAGPLALGSDPVVDRVDPMWRSSPTPYGPVALVALRAVAVLDVGLTGSVLLLRLLAVVGVAAAVAGALLLSAPERRPLVLALVVANPVTLLHLIGGAHLDALVAGLVTLALLAWRSGRSWSALLLAALAVACKVTVLPVFVLLVVVLVRRRGAPALATAASALALPFLVSGLILDRPLGFVDALMVSSAASPWYAPASVVGLVLRAPVALLGLSGGADLAMATGRVVVLLLGAAAVSWVLLTAWRDTAEGALARTVARAGVVLVLVSLALPSLYSWYLGPALFVVAATGAARSRHLLVVLCSLLSFSSLPSMYDASWWVVASAWALSLGALVWALRHRLVPAAVDGPAGVPRHVAPGAPAAAGPGRLPRVLVVVTRAIELTVLPALALAVTTTGAQAGVPDGPAARTQSENLLQDVAQVTDAVSAAYPEHKVARVLQRPAGELDVQLVLPGQRELVCWLTVRLDPLGVPVRVERGGGPGTRVAPGAPVECPPPAQAQVLGGLVSVSGSGAGR